MKRLKKILSSHDQIIANGGANFKARHTFAELDAIYSTHNGLCDLCGAAPSSRKFALDHNHLTGKLRGLLCFNCNTGLGSFRDDVTLLSKAIAYLWDRAG